MKIKNLTNQIQSLWIKNPREGNRSLSVEVRPHSDRDISDYYPDRSMMPDFDKIFAIVTNSNQVITAPKESENIEAPQTVEETKIEEPTVPETQEPTVIESKFICEHCGAEFASARGLSSHMNRSHPEINN